MGAELRAGYDPGCDLVLAPLKARAAGDRGRDLEAVRETLRTT